MPLQLDHHVGHDTPDQPTITNVSDPRGAPMGRRVWMAQPQGPLRLFQVRLDAGGYDRGGAYWGRQPGGQHLYCCTDGDSFRVFVRAIDRAGAMPQVQQTLTTAGFTATFAKE